MKKGIVLAIAWLTILAVSATWGSVSAAEFPTRPIEVVLPNAPGGGMDFVMTLFKKYAEKDIKQPILLTFKPGGGGTIGNVYAKALKPDGYSLVSESPSSLLLSYMTRKNAGYVMDDFSPICNLTIIPQVYCVKDDSPYKTMKQWIEAAKTKKMQYATFGQFSTSHIVIESLGKIAGFQATHIPYKGAAAAMTATLGGHADIAGAATTAFVGPGKLRLLAVASEKRLERYPDVPTLMELGYPINGLEYYSIWGPKNVPDEIADRLHAIFEKAYTQNKAEMTKIAAEQDHVISVLNRKELRAAYQERYEFFTKFLADYKL
ncbi:MAG: Tricarboxylate transport protein TctC [Deltaproteobacteria bacterium]|nr:Tricarboxylate transport protein TctC [Deltaproteobacteria bacterium]